MFASEEMKKSSSNVFFWKLLALTDASLQLPESVHDFSNCCRPMAESSPAAAVVQCQQPGKGIQGAAGVIQPRGTRC